MTAVRERPSTASPNIGVVPIRGRVIRTRSMSARLDPRAITVCLVLTGLIVAVSALSLSIGDFPIPLSDVIASLRGGGSDDADFIVRTLRLPRVLTAIGIGAAFGMSGAIFQSLARNPLGSPDIIGFNAGASAGAVIMIIWFGGSGTQVAFGAVAGGFVTAVLVFGLAWQRGVRVYRLVLVGIGIGFAAAAINDFLLTRAEINDVQQAAVWLTGSLNGRSWDHVQTIWLALVVLAPIAIVLVRWLDRLELGDDTAAGLGIPVNRAKLFIVLIAVTLAALAVAAAGPVGFVAFVSGPIARRLVRSPGACVIPAAFVGALVVVAADLLARRALAPTELPVGIMTSIMGAPYLLWLLTRQAKSGAL